MTRWMVMCAAIAMAIPAAHAEQPEETINVCNGGEDRDNNCECLDGYERNPGEGNGCSIRGGGGGGGGGTPTPPKPPGGGGGGGGGEDPPECPDDQVQGEDGGCRERTCDECAQAKKDCQDRGREAREECRRFDTWLAIDEWCESTTPVYPDGTTAPVRWSEACYTECVTIRHGANGEIICMGSREVCDPIPVAHEDCIDAWMNGMPGEEGSVGGGLGPINVGGTVVTDPTQGMLQACMQAGHEEKAKCNERKGSTNCIDECDGGLPPYHHTDQGSVGDEASP